jgi:proteasome lid subunit RPN8/RPN11
MKSLSQKVAKGKNPWSIEDESWSGILDHSLAAYPQEACGILLCPDERPGKIAEAYPTRNATSENPATRYLVEPLELLQVQKWAEQRQLDICGFYHSHPDHPAVPSEYDGQCAWEGYLYLILSLRDGVFADSRAWRWDAVQESFKEVF